MTGERRLAGEQLVQRDADRVHVAGGRRVAAGDQLRRQVQRGAHSRGAPAAQVHRALCGCPGLAGDPGDAEVREPHPAVVQQDVRGLQVAVHDAGRVCGGEAGTDLRGQAGGDTGRQRASVMLAERVQVAADDQVHNERELVALDDHVPQRHHVRVPEPDQGVPLADEPCHGNRVSGELGFEHLDGEPGSGGGVLAAPDHAHPALTDLVVEQVAAA